MTATIPKKKITHDCLARARKFITGNAWTFAKTYAKTAPHEYVVKDKLANEELKREFEWFAIFIHDHGYQEEFWGKVYTYLDIDDKKYWTEEEIINRADL